MKAAPYAPLADYAGAAGPGSTFWRIAVVLVALEAVWQATFVALGPAIGLLDRSTALGALMNFLSFLPILLAITWLVEKVQNRPMLSLLGPAGEAVLSFRRAAFAVLLLYLVLQAAPPWDTSGIALNRSPIGWTMILPLALPAILIQVTAEEAIFRGFLLQSLAARSASPLIWMVLPSAIFGALHFDPTLAPGARLEYMLWAGAFGMAAADLTARTGNLGAAIGLHFCVNATSVLLIGSSEGISGLALFVYTQSWQGEDSFNLIRLVFSLFFLWMNWMAVRIAIRR